jgi:hypothetical protein
VEKLVHIPKIFEFDEDERWRLSFSSSKIRLSVEDRAVTLKRVEPGFLGYFGSDPVYPTDEDLCVKTWVTTPQALTAWVAFDAWAYAPPGTSIGFRLSPDGAVQKYWDGSAWVDAHDGHLVGTTWVEGEWSTLQEVNDHISAFPVAQKAVQVIVNLRTTDPTVTPVVHGVGVLYEAFLNQYYDLIYDSLLAYVESICPSKEWVFRLVDDSAYIDLKAGTEYNVGTFNVVDVAKVFDQTNDPGHATNVKGSYDATTKRLTFASTILAGTEVWVQFSYQPTTAVITEQDFGTAAIPAVAIVGIDELRGARLPAGVWFKNRAAGTAVNVRSPYRTTLRLTMRIVADRQRDVSAILQLLQEKLSQEPLLTAVGTDEQYSMQIQKGMSDFGGPNLSDLVYKNFIIDILDVNYWVVGERTGSLVTSGLKASGDLSFTSGRAERP